MHEKLRYLRAPEGKALMLTNGTKVESLDELSEAIYQILPDAYLNHVAAGRNDFADWIDEVYGLTDLAQKIRAATSGIQMMILLEAFFRDL